MIEVPHLPKELTIPNMSTVFGLDTGQMDALLPSDEPRGSAARYWKAKFQEMSNILKTDFEGRATLLVGVINEMDGKLGNTWDIVQRRAYYQLGLTFERAGNASSNIDYYIVAAKCYIQADVLYGWWTGYAPRAINCLSAAGEIGIAQALTNEVFPSGPIVMNESEF